MSFLKKILKNNTERDGEEMESSKHSKVQRTKQKTKNSSQASSSSCPSSSSSSLSSSSSSTSSPHSTYQVRSSTNRHVAQVLPGLLLGSQEFSQDLSALQRYKVSHILNVTGEVSNAFPERFTYCRTAVADMPHVQLESLFDETFAFIEEARATGGCVLVHCYYGASRSASIVLGYLMRTERMRYREALAYLQMIRPEVYPNDGFDKQLRQYEQKLISAPPSRTLSATPPSSSSSSLSLSSPSSGGYNNSR